MFMSFNALDINLSILIEFTFSRHKNFIMFFCIFSNFLTIPVVIEKNKVKLALAIQTGALKIVVYEIIDTALLVALKTIKILSM